MIRKSTESDYNRMYDIINDAATAYRGVIPADRWRNPYMSREELDHEIRDGIIFWGYEENGLLTGVMGIQDRGDVTLIRHAYVATEHQRKGVGASLLSMLLGQTDNPVLIGTWADAFWAVKFYEKHGFHTVSPEEKDRLLRRYWKIPERQVETSVVLADKKYRNSVPHTGNSAFRNIHA
ncbi:MAG: GNAT family N-acetyltransferase [Spirochaetes bacterium RBG_13_51_14]|nr:MAG: GNAT family N-acetyltransferase [Spirochaetes bacterium RBG_13_51_14]